MREEFGYIAIQVDRPQTIGYGLTDSPVGQLAWIMASSASDPSPRRDARQDHQPRPSTDHVMTYWLTGTASSSASVGYGQSATWLAAKANSGVPTAALVSPTTLGYDDSQKKRTPSSAGSTWITAAISRPWKSRTSSSPTSATSSAGCDEPTPSHGTFGPATEVESQPTDPGFTSYRSFHRSPKLRRFSADATGCPPSRGTRPCPTIRQIGSSSESTGPPRRMPRSVGPPREAAMRNVALTLLHVLRRRVTDLGTGVRDGPVAAGLPPAARRRRPAGARRRPSRHRGIHYAGPAVQVRSELVFANPVPTLIDVTKDAQMIVVGSRGHGAWRRGLFGSASTGLGPSCPLPGGRHSRPRGRTDRQPRPGGGRRRRLAGIGVGHRGGVRRSRWRGADLVALHVDRLRHLRHSRSRMARFPTCSGGDAGRTYRRLERPLSRRQSTPSVGVQPAGPPLGRRRRIRSASRRRQSRPWRLRRHAARLCQRDCRARGPHASDRRASRITFARKGLSPITRSGHGRDPDRAKAKRRTRGHVIRLIILRCRCRALPARGRDPPPEQFDTGVLRAVLSVRHAGRCR